MRISKTWIRLPFTLALVICINLFVANSQTPQTGDQKNDHGGTNNGGNPNNGVNKKVEAPFDGGLTLLLAAGAGLGLKAAYKGKKKDQQNKFLK
ncbi:PID-CTERM protein-sorting domain-containing protein [Cnuella takakiae]|nr:hypothetical protein [Cnuella takakiae]